MRAPHVADVPFCGLVDIGPSVLGWGQLKFRKLALLRFNQLHRPCVKPNLAEMRAKRAPNVSDVSFCGLVEIEPSIPDPHSYSRKFAFSKFNQLYRSSVKSD